MAEADPGQPPGDHQHHDADEAVGGDREHGPGLPHAAQVHQRDHGHDDHRDDRGVRLQRGERRGQVRHARGHRHRDGQRVVDHQCAGDRQANPLPEVGAGHLVVPAAGRVRVHVLPVGGHHDQHQHPDGQRDPRRVAGEQRDAADRQHDQDLLGGVGHGGERVAGEHREGYPLRQQCVAEFVALHGAPDQHPLDNPEHHGHERMLGPNALVSHSAGNELSKRAAAERVRWPGPRRAGGSPGGRAPA